LFFFTDVAGSWGQRISLKWSMAISGIGQDLAEMRNGKWNAASRPRLTGSHER